MLASGKVKKCYWHQLVAPGYGLVNNLDGEIKKDAYFCFKHLITIFSGGNNVRNSFEKKLILLNCRKRGNDYRSCLVNGNYL